MRSAPDFRLLLLGLALLQSCVPASPAPTPEAVHQVTVSPAASSLAARWLSDYIEETGNTAIDLRPLSDPFALQAIGQEQAELMLSASPPPAGWFATPLAVEAAAVIVHPENPLRDLSLEELYALFSGAVSDWSLLEGDAVGVQVVILLEDNDVRWAFEGALPQACEPPGGAILAPDSNAVITLVQQNPGAVGYVPLNAAEKAEQLVRIVRVNGIRPGPSTISNSSYPILLEIVAASPQEPEGPVRDWLSWVQARGN